jgi:hypothetical protein
VCKVESAFLLFNPPTSIDKATSVNCAERTRTKKGVKEDMADCRKRAKLANKAARLFLPIVL